MDRYRAKLDLHGIYDDDIVEQILEERGVDNPNSFFEPSESDMYPLDALPNIEEAYEIIKGNVDNHNNIVILADVDVDGISAAAILYGYLKHYTDEIKVHINNGKRHGLSRNESYWDELIDVSLLIIVDSLNESLSEYQEVVMEGTSIVILDHHAVNPKVEYDDWVTLVTSQIDYPNKELSGAGVTWKFCKYYDKKSHNAFADRYLDLCACGLLADVTSMKEMENRYLVYRGLYNMRNIALKKIIGGYEFDSTSVLFSIAPLVNASNRMNQNKAALETFLSEDEDVIENDIIKLKLAKQDQDNLVSKIMDDVESQCNEQLDKGIMRIMMNGNAEVSGLVATKICDKYKRPVIVLKDFGDEYRGSLRSNGIDLMALVNKSGLGRAVGHEQAAGCFCKANDFEKLIEYLNQEIDSSSMEVVKEVDVFMGMESLSFALAEEIERVDFVSGKNFNAVKFLVDGITDYTVRTLKDGRHLVISPNEYIDIIKWNSTYDVQEFEDAALMDLPLTAVGTLQISDFAGKHKVQLICDEIMIQGD